MATQTCNTTACQPPLKLDSSVAKATELSKFKAELEKYGIQAQETAGHHMPSEAAMHDRAATVPALVVSPKSEWGISKTLSLMKERELYDHFQISVKSGGHGYFNGASCPDIMLNLALMNQRWIEGNSLFLQPGCLLAHTIDILAKYKKAVPHGDCFGVGAGGHFLTAGWDPILGREYGLGCQSVVGGRLALWGGEVLEVNQETHPQLLYAMRGGAAAEAGVVTEIKLKLIDQPIRATWCYTPITREQLQLCTTKRAFQNAASLPNDISVSFRFHFVPSQAEPVCSFNIASLLTAQDTIATIYSCLGVDVGRLVDDKTTWNEKTLLDLRLLPASKRLIENPGMLAEASARGLHETPEVFWDNLHCVREMAPSYFQSISYWVKLDCDEMLLELWKQFDLAKESNFRSRMYALVILGGGAITAQQGSCSMPLGEALARFELHWDDSDQKHPCEEYTRQVSQILEAHEDKKPGRPYRGDIWRTDQAYHQGDPLKEILEAYDRRSSPGSNREARGAKI